MCIIHAPKDKVDEIDRELIVCFWYWPKPVSGIEFLDLKICLFLVLGQNQLFVSGIKFLDLSILYSDVVNIEQDEANA